MKRLNTLFWAALTVLVFLALLACDRPRTNETEAPAYSDAIIEPSPEAWARYPVPLEDGLQRYISRRCDETGIRTELVLAMIERESDYDADVIGDDGNSFGLMQIYKAYHEERMCRLSCYDLLDPYENVTVGIDILRELSERDKPVEWVLMAYNGGAGYADKLSAAGEVSDYAREVLERAEQLAESVMTEAAP